MIWKVIFLVGCPRVFSIKKTKRRKDQKYEFLWDIRIIAF